MTKVISLADDAYFDLKSIKREDESFSDIVRRITIEEKKKSIMEFAGMWKDNKEMEAIFKDVLKERKNFKMRNL